MGQNLTPDHPGLKRIQDLIEQHIKKNPIVTYEDFRNLKDTVENHPKKDDVHKAQGLILDNLDELVGRQG